MDSESNKPTNFSAADSALGYFYQIRLALLSSLRRLSKDVSFSVYFETLDDVVFEQAGMSVELLQLKHHCKHAPNLTDMSPDLWKSLRVWMEGRANDTIPADGQLFLVTTSAVSSGSAVSMLLAEKRDVAEAAKRLANIATTSANQTNAPAYQLFRELGDDARIQLLESVTVIPQAPSIDDTGSELCQEVRLTVCRKHVESFLSRLEGWWVGRAQRQMIDPETSPILSNELESKVDDLREQFKRDALPVDHDILYAEVDAEAYENAIFVHQAKLTGIRNQRVLTAIRDYFRAFEQRSRWMREDLLLVAELDRYEKYLREEWQLAFDRVADELGEDAADDTKRRVAQAIYAWVEKSCFPIREQVKHPSMSRGSLHILADRLHVGWHPDFMDRLQHLLEPKKAS